MHLPEVTDKKLIYRESFIKKHFPDFYGEIMQLYPDSIHYNEKIYRYLHNIDIIPKCPVCGYNIPYRNSPAGYGKFCSRLCMSISKERLELIRETKEKRYGDSKYNNSSQSKQTMIEKYGGVGLSSQVIREKVHNTCLEKYGVTNVFELQEFQDIARDRKEELYGDPCYTNREKSIKTCMKKYGVENPMQNKEIKHRFNSTMKERYGVDWAMQNPELVNKLSDSLKKVHQSGKYNDTHRLNRTFNTSKIEMDFKSYLDESNIEYVYQYKSDKYPFDCDFYIPYYDLYIELQGHWTHGKHPYVGSLEDQSIIDKWRGINTKFYNHAIYVWTELDVKKRQIAKDNKINYLEIFSINIDVCIKQLNDKINTLICR